MQRYRSTCVILSHLLLQYNVLCYHLPGLLSPDITEYSGTTTISAGLVTSSSSCASLRIIDDPFLEGDHQLTFTIDGVTPMAGVSFGSPTTHVLTIMDNDGE